MSDMSMVAVKASQGPLCAFPGRTLLEGEMKGLIAGLLHEAEHAQQAAQRTAALDCLQASPFTCLPYSSSGQ